MTYNVYIPSPSSCSRINWSQLYQIMALRGMRLTTVLFTCKMYTSYAEISRLYLSHPLTSRSPFFCFYTNESLFNWSSEKKLKKRHHTQEKNCLRKRPPCPVQCLLFPSLDLAGFPGCLLEDSRHFDSLNEVVAVSAPLISIMIEISDQHPAAEKMWDPIAVSHLMY